MHPPLLQLLRISRHPGVQAALLACVGVAVAYLAWHWGGLGLEYEWQWNRVWRHLGQWTSRGFVPGPLLKGAALTAALTALGIILAAFIGTITALLILSPWPLCSVAARTYVCLWRTTPLLLQLFFAYFLISPLLNLTPFTTALLALAVFEGAYMAEVVRAAIHSVPKAQWEAAFSLGFGPLHTLALVIGPQALANSWATLANQAIATLKDTSLVSAIAVADLTMRSQAIVAETFLAFEVWLLAGTLYILMAICLAIPALWLERHRPWNKNKGDAL